MADTDTAPTSAANEPSLVDAVVHVFEVGQRLVLDRVDLARFDLSRLAGRTLRGAALIVTGAVLLAGAWFTAMGGVTIWLQQYLSLVASLVLVAGLSAGLGVGAIAIGIRRARGEGAFDTAGELLATGIRPAATTSNGIEPG